LSIVISHGDRLTGLPDGFVEQQAEGGFPDASFFRDESDVHAVC
jgi:hypothetical protein